jgi:transcriptional regulator with XRE-family HTH domain
MKRRTKVIHFGNFVKELRIKKALTLREFCRRAQIDAGNWSKIERGVLPPPKSKEVLNEIARGLDLSSGSEEFNTLFDLAAISCIPPEIVTNDSIIDKLPVFFRTLRGEKPTRAELEKLIKILKENK